MRFKSIAITGHTSGIGKGLYDHFSNLGHEVRGYSKDTGFDISKKEDILTIINDTIDCDLFFNNAYSGYSQSILAEYWHKNHWNNSHYIISTSSIAAEPLADIPTNFPWLAEYGKEKYAISKSSWNINHSGSKCKAIVIMPGVCKTNFYNPYDTKEHNGLELYKKVIETNSIITVDDLVKIIDNVILSINGRNFISHITVQNGY